MSIKGISPSSSIEEKTAWAETCYREFRNLLLKDKTTVDLLKRQIKATHASSIMMKKAGIADICRECERNEGGSCCGAGMENRYDGWLLLINLLLDARLPKERYDPSSCFFLGETGCLLRARHVICVNYICRKITDRIDQNRINALREKEGEELNTLFLLNEHIKQVLTFNGHTAEKKPVQSGTVLRPAEGR
jgi:hypothetical protein